MIVKEKHITMKATKLFTLLALLMALTMSCSNSKTTERNNNNAQNKNAVNKTKNNNHDYVDLGLPSGTLWATCNVGAEQPESYGQYFAWGEIQGYTEEQVLNGEKGFAWEEWQDAKPSRIVYVSCNPETLARDLKLFEGEGYKPEKACPVDMFCFTEHVESVVLMSKV